MKLRELLTKTKEGAKTVAIAVGAFAVSAITWWLGLSAAGAGLLVAGVFVLAGFGWALIAAGASCIVGAAIVKRGMSSG